MTRMMTHRVIRSGLMAVLLLGCDRSNATSSGDSDGTNMDLPPVVRTDLPMFENCPAQRTADACANGWCRIEPGTFLWGTPEDSGVPCSSNYGEVPVQVTLTRPFLMQQHEVTQAQWEALGFPNPSRDVHPDKPITWINWFEALAYCNALSEKEGFDTCYDLSRCTGQVGDGCSDEFPFFCSSELTQRNGEPVVVYTCLGDIHKYPNRYDCPGYRLPTAVEWQYAARACTASATYNGDMPGHLDFGGYCDSVKNLDPIAWHCGNATELQIVKTRRPNAWHLYDMLGNAMEYVDHQTRGLWLEYEEGKEGPLTDPVGDRSVDTEEVIRKYIAGGSFNFDACLVRSAYFFPDGGLIREYTYGFRPVRTLFPDTDSDSGK